MELNLKAFGRTALTWAASRGHAEIVRLLLEQSGIELNVTGEYGLTPLIAAAKEGYTEVVKLLLEQDGVEPNLKDSRRAALSWAARGGYAETVKLLLEQGGIELKLRGDRVLTALQHSRRNTLQLC